MTTDTLNPEQIKAWRHIILMQIEKISPGGGVYALVMPEAEVIAYWREMKNILEQPEPVKVERKQIKAPCDHSNSFTGNKGKYCIDCEKYL